MICQLTNGWQRLAQTVTRRGTRICDPANAFFLCERQNNINAFATGVDADAIASGIDLARYPLHNFASAEMQDIISDARSQLMATG